MSEHLYADVKNFEKRFFFCWKRIFYTAVQQRFKRGLSEMKYELNANLKYVLTSDDSISFGECTKNVI